MIEYQILERCGRPFIPVAEFCMEIAINANPI